MTDSFLERNDFTRTPAASADFFQRLTPPLLALWGLVFAPLCFPAGAALSAAALVAEARNRRRWPVLVTGGLGLALSLFVGGVLFWVRFVFAA